jgi:hypothetical protein
MGHRNSSGDNEQMVSKWKKGTIEYINELGELTKFSGTPAKLLSILNKIERNPGMRLAGKGLRKSFELKDVPDKAWRFVRKIKYLPMHCRSKRNEFRRIFNETCCIGYRPKEDDPKGGDQ